MIACDGLWKSFSMDESIQFVNNVLQVGTSMEFKLFSYLNIKDLNINLNIPLYFCTFFTIKKLMVSLKDFFVVAFILRMKQYMPLIDDQRKKFAMTLLAQGLPTLQYFGLVGTM